MGVSKNITFHCALSEFTFSSVFKHACIRSNWKEAEPVCQYLILQDGCVVVHEDLINCHGGNLTINI